MNMPINLVTGRRNHKSWIEMTEKNFMQNGIGTFFQEKFFTPKGTKSALNKAIVVKDQLKKYQTVNFYEDDVETAVFLAWIFEERIKVHLIYHSINKPLYAKLQIRDFPNIELLNVTEKYAKS